MIRVKEDGRLIVAGIESQGFLQVFRDVGASRAVAGTVNEFLLDLRIDGAILGCVHPSHRQKRQKQEKAQESEITLAHSSPSMECPVSGIWRYGLGFKRKMS